MDAVPEQTKKPRNTKRQREAGEAARRETKRQLLVAATEVFLKHGYAATSVSAIAYPPERSRTTDALPPGWLLPTTTSWAR